MFSLSGIAYDFIDKLGRMIFKVDFCFKVLTLASNERIPLTPSMRMLFEISHLKAATPATVSR